MNSKNSQKNIWAYWTCLTVLLLGSLLSACSKQASNQQYGRQLVAKYTVSAQQIDAFMEFAEQGKNAKPLNSTSSLMSETKDWISPSMLVDMESGPYTVVATLNGVTRYKGDVSTLWNVGWTVDGGVRSQAFPGLSKLDVKGNQEVRIVKAAPPVHFREKKTVSLVLGLVKMENLNLQSMEVEVWSGIPAYSWSEVLWAFRWLGLGVILFLLRYYWVRR